MQPRERKINSGDDDEIKALTTEESDYVRNEFTLPILNGFECPITTELMEDPVMAADGHSYERKAIEEWLAGGRRISPMTGEKLEHTLLIPNLNLKKAIQHYLSLRPGLAAIRRKVRAMRSIEQEMKDLAVAVRLREEDLAAMADKLRESKQGIVSVSNHRQPQENVKNNQELIVAVKRGDAKEVDRLLKNGADVNTGSIHTNTPLFQAIQQPGMEMFRLLIEAKANVSRRNRLHYTVPECIALACPWSSADKKEALTLLERQGVRVRLSPLHEAACLGDAKILEEAVAQDGEKLLEVKDSHGNTVFHYAAANGQIGALEIFYKNFPEKLNIQNDEGATLLHFAAENGHFETVQWLQARGAILTEKDRYDRTALLLAAANGHLNIVQWLFENGVMLTEKDNMHCSALLFAAMNNHLNTAAWLLKQGMLVTDKDKNGNSLFFLAAKNGHLEMMRLLFRHGSNLTEKRKGDDMTALHFAAREGHIDVMQWLHLAGVTLTEKEKYYGYTALLLAASNGHFDIVRWLYNEGSILTDNDTDGMTALHLAVAHNHFEGVKWLVEHGASIKAKSNDGNTALHYAASKDQFELVQWLVSHGAVLTEKNIFGETALHLAARYGHFTTAQFLAEKGKWSLLSIKNNNKETAYDVARKDDVKKLLGRLEKQFTPSFYERWFLKSNVSLSALSDNKSSLSQLSSAVLPSDSKGNKDFGELEKSEKLTFSPEDAMLYEWYDDARVNDLLKYYFGNSEDLRVLPALPLDNDEGMTSQLIQDRLTTAFADNSTINVFYLPLRINTNHWIGLYIDKTTNNPLVYWIDPYGGLPDARKEQICILLKETGIFDVTLTPKHISFQEYPLQNDGINCGPWIIEILKYIRTKGAFPRVGEIDIDVCRCVHSDILEGQPYQRLNTLDSSSHNSSNVSAPLSSKRLIKEEKLNDPTSIYHINSSSSGSKLSDYKGILVSSFSSSSVQSHRVDETPSYLINEAKQYLDIAYPPTQADEGVLERRALLLELTTYEKKLAENKLDKQGIQNLKAFRDRLKEKADTIKQTPSFLVSKSG